MAPHMNKTRPSVEDVDEPRLTVSGAARRLGIAPATLRTWDRRYGIGPTEHAHGRHRRYSADDMARLELMQRALMQGAAPAEAARYARTAACRSRPRRGARSPTTAPPRSRRQPQPLGARTSRSAPPSPPVPRSRAAAAVPRCGCRGPAPGPAGSAGPRWRWTPTADAAPAWRSRIAADGLVATWDEVARPVLAAVGERWATTGRGVEIEHLLSQCLVAVFVRVAGSRTPRPRRSPSARSCWPRCRPSCTSSRSPCSPRCSPSGGSAAARSEPPCPPTPSPRRCAGPRPPPSCSGRRLPSTADARRRRRTAGHPAALPHVRRWARLERRRPAAGRRCARLAGRRGRAHRRAPCCGERRRRPDEPASPPCAADAVVQRVAARGYRAGRHE